MNKEEYSILQLGKKSKKQHTKLRFFKYPIYSYKTFRILVIYYVLGTDFGKNAEILQRIKQCGLFILIRSHFFTITFLLIFIKKRLFLAYTKC